MTREELKRELIEVALIKFGPDEKLENVVTKEKVTEMATKLKSLKKELPEEGEDKEIDRIYQESRIRVSSIMRLFGMDPGNDFKREE